jgi:hypothetical protein
MPQHEGSSVSDEIGFVRWQHGAQEPQVPEFAEFRKWRRLIPVDRERECRAILEEAQEDQVLVINEGFDLLSRQQDGMRGLASRQASVAPDGHKAAFAAFRCSRKPFGVLAPFAAAINKRACEYILILHPGS